MSDDFEELKLQIAALTERIERLEHAGKPTAPSVSTQPRRAKAELESRIGGHWLNRVGILAVLVGVSYFLKYAFENEWIGPAGRVLMGLVAGIGVVIWSDRVRRGGQPIFSYSLNAIGIGVLYLSLWAASQLYHLVPNALAFFAMITVTAATVALALWENAEVIEAFAAVGAFITPVVLSTGVNNTAGLFSYLFILDVGALILIRYRPWVRVAVGSYLGTLILYSSWHSTFYTPGQFPIAFLSVSALFATFALAPFVARHSRSARALAVLALLNAGTYFFEVWELFEHEAENRQAAIAAVALACVYFLIAYLLGNRVDVIAGVHWAIGAAFLIAAVPIGMNAQWITIGWFVEGAALIRMSRRQHSDYLKGLGLLALILGIVRLLAIDEFQVMHLFLNWRMATFAIAIAALAVVAHTFMTDTKDDDKTVLTIVIVLMNVFALMALTQEITDEWRRQLQAGAPAEFRTLEIVRDFAYSALWMIYGAGLIIIGFWKKSRFLRWQALILIGLTVCKVFIYDMSSLDRVYRILSFMALGLILLATSFLYQRSSAQRTQ